MFEYLQILQPRNKQDSLKNKVKDVVSNKLPEPSHVRQKIGRGRDGYE